MTGFVPKPFSNLPVPPPSTTFTVTIANPPPVIMEEIQFLLGVKIAAAIISLVILIAALYKYWISNYFSNGGQTVVSSSVTGTGGDVVVQVRPPTLNMTDFALASV
nr:hypothetical protein CFP56_65104 [Quercus suber]